jgi:hypothetical protein
MKIQKPNIDNISKPKSLNKNSNKKTWKKLFEMYGIESIPEERLEKTNNYGKIITWVTQDRFEMDEHVSLAIDIWLGHVNVWDDEWLNSMELKPNKPEENKKPKNTNKKSLFSP